MCQIQLALARTRVDVCVWRWVRRVRWHCSVHLRVDCRNDERRASALDICKLFVFSFFGAPLITQSSMLLHLLRFRLGTIDDKYASRFGLAESLWTHIWAQNRFFFRFLCMEMEIGEEEEEEDVCVCAGYCRLVSIWKCVHRQLLSKANRRDVRIARWVCCQKLWCGERTTAAIRIFEFCWSIWMWVSASCEC